MQHREDVPTTLEQSGTAGPIGLGPVRMVVLGSVAATGMLHMSRMHSLDSFLRSSRRSRPGISPHSGTTDLFKPKTLSHGLNGKFPEHKIKGEWEG